MKFYLSLTDENGVLLDRFRLEMPASVNPDDECVSEDSEAVGSHVSERDTCERLLRHMRHALKEKPAPEPAPAPKPTLAKVRRFSRREAVATALNTDISDVTAYQPGHFLGVYTEGTHYYCAVKTGDTVVGVNGQEELGPWKILCDADYLRGWVVWVANGEGN
jgi:hypothetical protein